jgi:DNA repair protein RecN (Recombination protein N)
MLRYLRISNLAVISNIEMEFASGLNLLTGETGSGKSIIVDSLSFLLGSRVSADVIRGSAARGFVEGIFRVGESQGIADVLEGAGVDAAGEELFLRREINRSGPSRAFVNDRLVTVSFLRQMRSFLVDIHGQSDHHSLRVPSSHMDVLDAYAGALRCRREVEELYRRIRQKQEELNQLLSREAERVRMIDIYEYQLGEIDRAALLANEDEELQQERRRLQNAERLSQLVNDAYRLIYDDERSMLSLSSDVRRRLEQLLELDGRSAVAANQLQEAKVLLEEVAYFLREYLERMETSPLRLQQVMERLGEIDRLKRKYGPTIQDIFSQREQMESDLQRLKRSDELREGLAREVEDLRAEYARLSQSLSTLRRNAAPAFERGVVEQMRALAMEQGRFAVSFTGVDDLPAERGAERVEFLISVNPGEVVGPLGQVASGGELSRIVLAIKSVAAEQSGPLVLVFDEIDVGIGGRVAEQVGVRLKKLSESYQVFCVTHQPQIARFADAHYSVRKVLGRDETEVVVERLGQRTRIEELARMLAGSEVTDVSRRHARELLKIA